MKQSSNQGTSNYNLIPCMFSPEPPGPLLVAIPLANTAAVAVTLGSTAVEMKLGFPESKALTVAASFGSAIIVLAG
jgi:hypothetical protein